MTEADDRQQLKGYARALLDRTEATRLDGLIECGCMVDDDTAEGGGLTIEFCPLHAAAPSLLAALRFIAQHLEGSEEGEEPLYGALHLAQHARAAIDEVSGS